MLGAYLIGVEQDLRTHFEAPGISIRFFFFGGILVTQFIVPYGLG